MRWLGLILFSSLPAFANNLEISYKFGKPLFFVEKGSESGNEPVFDTWAAQIDIQKYSRDMPFAFGVYWTGYFTGSLGFLPMSHSGVSLSYFPFSIPSDSYSLDGQVEVSRNALAIYFKGCTGISFFNFRNDDLGGKNFVLGASAFNLQMGGGLDYPVTDNLTLGVESTYFATFGGTEFTTDENADPESVQAYGFNFLLSIGYFWR